MFVGKSRLFARNGMHKFSVCRQICDSFFHLQHDISVNSLLLPPLFRKLLLWTEFSQNRV